ncbi:MAG: hypothetical protein FWC82_04130 [Firmicutes bacterium]|nr:hypothetical protein [Bacillota bacterium]
MQDFEWVKQVRHGDIIWYEPAKHGEIIEKREVQGCAANIVLLVGIAVALVGLLMTWIGIINEDGVLIGLIIFGACLAVPGIVNIILSCCVLRERRKFLRVIKELPLQGRVTLGTITKACNKNAGHSAMSGGISPFLKLKYEFRDNDGKRRKGFGIINTDNVETHLRHIEAAGLNGEKVLIVFNQNGSAILAVKVAASF